MSSTATAQIRPEVLDALRAQVRGTVSTPDDPGYDAARQGWNLAFEVRPAVVVEVASAEDVAVTLHLAASAGIGVGVQSTGHGLTRAADDQVLIVTRGLDELSIDPATRIARLGAGLTWAPVLEAAAQHGLSPLVGSTPHVGVVGFTLGGGTGWLSRKHGRAAERLVAVELVTPDGQAHRVTAASQPELFWALRGGGVGNLGVVTAIEIELVELAEVYGGTLIYPAEVAADAFAQFRAWVADAPDELTASIAVMNLPPFEDIPEPLRGGSFVFVRGCWCGPVDEGPGVFAPWSTWREPMMAMVSALPTTQIGVISDDPVDPMPALLTSVSLADIDVEVVNILLSHTLPAGGPPALIFSEVLHLGGALAPGNGGPGAAALAQTPFVVKSLGLVDPGAPEPLEAHLAALRDALDPYRLPTAVLNLLDGEERVAAADAAFSAEERERIARVKADVDPDNVLRFGFATA